MERMGSNFNLMEHSAGVTWAGSPPVHDDTERSSWANTVSMSCAIAVSTAHSSVRSKPPYSAAFHQASRKSATTRHWPLSP